MRNWARDWELCQKATSGPWKWSKWSSKDEGYTGMVYYENGHEVSLMGVGSECDDDYDIYIKESDARFIAEAREALPYWLRRYKELHAKWFADVEEKIRLRYTNQQLHEELVRLKDIILKFARYADDHKTVLICPEETLECSSLCSICWQAALDGRKEDKEV